MTLDIQKINSKLSQNFGGILEYAAVFRNHPIYIQKIGFYVSAWVAAERNGTCYTPCYPRRAVDLTENFQLQPLLT
jgi:hypothetical protein